MRTRAYRPEVPGCLEGRAMLSGVVGQPGNPYVLTRRQYTVFVEQVRQSFDLFGRDLSFTDLNSGLSQALPFLPFGQVDLAKPVNRIVDELRQELAAHVPHAIRAAYDEIIALGHADVVARVQAGDVVPG